MLSNLHHGWHFVNEWRLAELDITLHALEVIETSLALSNLGTQVVFPAAIIYYFCANTQLHFSNRTLI
jgi:hypothetical protein